MTAWLPSALRTALLSHWHKRRARKQGIKIDLASLRQCGTYLEIEAGASMGRVTLRTKSLRVGAMSYLRSGCELDNIAKIGRYCSIGNDVVLGQERTGHPLDWVSTHPFQHTGTKKIYTQRADPTQIGHDVWIGREAMIMEDTHLGTGCVIAARAVVTHDVPPYAVVAGVPARIVRYRFPADLAQRLLDSRWWDRPVATLADAPTDMPDAFLDYLDRLPSAQHHEHRCFLIGNGRFVELPLADGT